MDGSLTSTFWKRRLKAWSFSNTWRYSVKVVEPIQRSSPDANAGLIKFDTSILLLIDEPAPIIIWISSINKIALGLAFKASNSAFIRFSKSPRYFVPAISAPISKLYTTQPDNGFGALSLTISHAKPSAIDVLPTPGSPTSRGLFLRRRHKICAVRSISAWRPINGSVPPVEAFWLRLMVNSVNGSLLAFSPVSSVSTLVNLSRTFLSWPCDRYWVNSSRVTPCFLSKYTA